MYRITGIRIGYTLKIVIAQVEKSSLSFTFHLEVLDSCKILVRSKVTALVKRAPPVVKKFIRGWNEKNDFFAWLMFNQKLQCE